MFPRCAADVWGVKRTGLVAILVLLLACGGSAALAKSPVAGKSVVGGSRISVAQVPYVVSVLTERTLCTGSVVSPVRVVTAAHCVVPAQMRVRAGSASALAGGQEVAVSSVKVHPEYRRMRNGGLVNDIAVLTLAEPVGAPPIKLADPALDAAMTAAGVPAFAVGFGHGQVDARKKPQIGILRGALQFFRPGLCTRYKLPAATSLCTVGERWGAARTGDKRRSFRRSPCQGDSGGPLVGFSPSGPQLVGVASTVGGKRPRGFAWVRCGLQGQGAVYTRVSAFLDFIQGA